MKSNNLLIKLRDPDWELRFWLAMFLVEAVSVAMTFAILWKWLG